MGSIIVLNIELSAIESFLKMTIDSANKEYRKIKKQSEAGAFSHYDDEANAYFVPEMWEEIALKSTLGELNALVEWELQNLASKTFHDKNTKTKSILSRKLFDLKFGEIIKLIQDYYKIKIEDITCYADVKRIRDKVNAFKHRKGYKDIRRDTYTSIPEQHEVSRNEGFQSIEAVRTFIKDIWAKTIK